MISLTVSLVVYCLIFLGVEGQQSSLQCPVFSLVNISADDQDILVFAAFPPDTEPPENDYNPGAIGPWYDIGSGIVDVVQPGSVTEDVIVPLIRSSNVNFSSLDSFTSYDNQQLQDFGNDLAEWWAGIIALTVLGGLLAISFLVCCCCFGLCRCCGNCGGNLKQVETGKTNCLTIVFTIILVVFVCWLIAGVVLAFFSNQQVFDSVSEFEDTVNNTFNLAESFINDSVSKIETLLCEVNDTFDVTEAQADALIVQVNDVINDFSGKIYRVVDMAISVSQEIEAIQGTLSAINRTVVNLTDSTASINASLQVIASNISAANSSCFVLMVVDCSPLDASVFRNGLGADFNAVPNIGSELASVQNILDGVNLTETALEGNMTFNSAVGEITNLTTDVDQVIGNGLNQLRDVTVDANDVIRNFTDRAVGSDGFINDGREAARTGFKFIRQYDIPRYAVGVVISCSAVVVVIIVLLGVLCGLCGFRTDRAPYERTDISNCGGVTLIFAAFIAFFMGFLVMLLSALVFFAGGVSTKFCQDLAPPEYTIFRSTIDDPSLTGGEYLLSEALFGNGSVPLTISGILVSCSGNATVYQALKLENLNFIQEIQNFTNISRIIPDVSLNVSSLSNQISDVFDSDSFVPADLQSRVDDFTSVGIETINISQFRDQLNRGILSFDITNQIFQLRMFRDNISNINFTIPGLEPTRDNLVGQINSIIDELVEINGTVSGLNPIVDELEENINELETNADTLTNAASSLLANVNSTFDDLVDNGVTPLVGNASSVFPRAIGYAQQLVDFGFDALQNEVGNCRPIAAVYSGFFNSYCSFTVDGLNGFWLALGMCGMLMIPIIIFSVVTSHYYRRMKYEEDSGIPYESSFPMKTY